MKRRIAYLVNQYPKPSHSFIRREIAALERRGWQVERCALRGWDQPAVDPDDAAEQGRTRYVLRDGLLPLLIDVVAMLAKAPRRFLAALGLALRMARRADRALPYHLAYFAEACRLAGWLRASGATHLHAHFGTNPAEVAMLAHALGGPPYSFTVHGPEEFDRPRALGLAEKVRRAAFVVAISSYGRSQLYRWVEHAHWPKVKLVPCGLENAFHDVAPSPPPPAPRLACVGRLCEQKGQLVLLEAAARLAARGLRFELVLVGDGEMRPDLETFIRKNQLEVRITGWLSSAGVRAEILAARALVLPSFAEGLPVVIMEAMALRRPVLATCIAGVPELVQHGETGWLCPPGDVDALAAALEELLSRPAAELQAMGEAGHARVLERHCVDASAARLAGLFAA
jgi:glycosyltransferase involved in cell wall biosynthesis